MRLALKEARAARARGDEPFGAALVSPNGDVLLAAGNTQNTQHDPSAHAELNAIRRAAALVGTTDLSGYILFATSAPCPMCTSVAVQSGIQSIVYGAAFDDAPDSGTSTERMAELFGTETFVESGVLEAECRTQRDSEALEADASRDAAASMPQPRSVVLTNARIPGMKELHDVAVRDGIIEKLGPSIEPPENALVIDCRRNVLLPGLVEPHVHLEKAYLESRSSNRSGTLSEAIALTGELKKGFTEDDMYARGRRVLQHLSRWGVTAVRAHVEVDPVLQLRAIGVAEALQVEFEDHLELQIAVFPQEGIHKAPGTEELMREAAKHNVSAVGGVPYNDLDPRRHLEFVFDLAREKDLDVDLHVDFSAEPAQRDILHVIDLTREYGWSGRVNVAHLTSLGTMTRDESGRIAREMAAAGISVTTLPLTDLYINGKNAEQPTPRGLTAIESLIEAGATVSCGGNNIRNAFTPFGRGDPIFNASILAIAAQMGAEEEQTRVLEMITRSAAATLSLERYGIEVGGRADLVLLDTEDPRLVLSEVPDRLLVFKNGRITMSRMGCTDRNLTE